MTSIVVLQCCAALVVGGLLLRTWRWIAAQSAAIGWIVAAAVLVRAGLGLMLFWISYLHLPVATSAQIEGGFWQVAPDATGYFHYASELAGQRRLMPLDHSLPAPAYIDVLATWMIAVGTSPASAMYLQLCLYVGLMALIVRAFKPINDWRADWPCLIAVAAYSFSPVVLLHSTQPLKDEMAGMLVAAACLSLQPLAEWLDRDQRGGWLVLATAVPFGLSVMGTTGIRWYYGIMLWAVMAVTLAAFAIPRTAVPRRRYLAAVAAIVMAGWIGFWAGAGPYYDLVAPVSMRLDDRDEGLLTWILQLPGVFLNSAEMARTGFLMSGGRTNMVVALREDGAAGEAHAEEVTRAYYSTATFRRRAREREQERLEREARELERLDAERRAAEQQREAAERERPAAQQATAAALAANESVEHTVAREAAARAAAEQAAHERAAAERAAAEAAALRARAGRGIPITISDHIKVMIAGLSVLFVPITILRQLSLLPIVAGGGLMAASDLDTMAMDVSLLLLLQLLWQRRHALGHYDRFVAFGLLLSAATALLLAYVVTNFGTLWRMRSIVAIPIWTLAIALSPHSTAMAPATDDARSTRAGS